MQPIIGSDVQCKVEKLPYAVVRRTMSHGKCRDPVAVAMAVPIENPADCELQGVILFLQADEILGYLTEKVSSRVELFCCTIMHVRILPWRYKPCCVSTSIGISSSILRTVRNWHGRTFSFPKMKEHLVGKLFENDEDVKNGVGSHMV